jgi:hypothetical protein
MKPVRPSARRRTDLSRYLALQRDYEAARHKLLETHFAAISELHAQLCAATQPASVFVDVLSGEALDDVPF